MIETFTSLATEWAWIANAFGLLLMAATRFLANSKTTWALVGMFLLVIAIGNALLYISVGLNPALQFASLFGVVVLGSLGARFIGNWLTDGAV